ncbi:hypothetical protein ACFZB9_07235 [Kitasatospora sp. NPDC008050]|uniref:hypothetical protein n=1 Tax=Kitasatospora sp. NPDC008050 TaxID=3364021 RepID=UPI0036E65788
MTGLTRAAAHALGVDGLTIGLLAGAGRSELLGCSDRTARTFRGPPVHPRRRPGPRRRPHRFDHLRAGSGPRPPGPLAHPEHRDLRSAHPGRLLLPLAIGAIRVGVLTALRRATGPLGHQQAGDALVLASALTARYLGGSPAQPGTPPLDGLPRALRHAIVHRATGMLSVQLALPLPRALLRLRAHAYGTGRPITDVSRDIVDCRLRLDDDGAATPPSGGEKD